MIWLSVQLEPGPTFVPGAWITTDAKGTDYHYRNMVVAPSGLLTGEQVPASPAPVLQGYAPKGVSHIKTCRRLCGGAVLSSTPEYCHPTRRRVLPDTFSCCLLSLSLTHTRPRHTLTTCTRRCSTPLQHTHAWTDAVLPDRIDDLPRPGLDLGCSRRVVVRREGGLAIGIGRHLPWHAERQRPRHLGRYFQGRNVHWEARWAVMHHTNYECIAHKATRERDANSIVLCNAAGDPRPRGMPVRSGCVPGLS